MGLKYMKDRDLFKGHNNCIPSGRMEFPTEISATTLLDLQSVFQTFAFTTGISIAGFFLEILTYYVVNECKTVNGKGFS